VTAAARGGGGRGDVSVVGTGPGSASKITVTTTTKNSPARRFIAKETGNSETVDSDERINVKYVQVQRA